MHLRAFLAASVGAVLLAGCGTGSPTAPGGYQAAALPTIQSFSDGSGMTIGTLGLFRLHVDAATMAATVEPIRTRIAQDNDDLYQLAINSFLGSDTLTVQDIDLDGDSLDLTYAITHPFDAPTNLAGPATAANRADLGVAGMVCLLADVDDAAGNTYFDASPDVVIANTDAIANADGYYRPAGLFDTGGTIANTFPYKLLVDETLDPRTGRDGTPLSNGGNPQGNYDPATLGWQQGNIGAARNGWTGYGVLHQGQVATNTLEFPLASLESSELELTVAVLAKYNDPRQGASGTARKANRLPASPADITKFGYRMPHGALDVESIEFSGESGGFLANQVSSSTLSFHVVDWDARATASTSDPLSADPAVDTVVDGAQGTPALSVCIPGVTGSPNIEVFFGPNPTDDDSAFGGDAAADSGEPGDALFFSEAIGKGAGTGEAAGTYTGLVKVVDAATSDVLALDETLTPIAAHVPEPVTYQAFTVTMADPTWVQHYGEIAQPTSFTDVAVDSTGDIFAAGAFYGTVDFGQGPVASAGSADILLVNFSPTGQVEWVQTAGAGGLDSALGVAVAPTGDIWIAGRFQNAIQFSGGPTHVSAGGVDVFQTRFNSAGALQSSTRYGGTGDEQANAVACAVDGSFVYTVGQFTGATNMGTSPYTSAGGTDIFVRGGSSGNAVEQWSVVYGASGSDLGLSIVADPTGPTLYAGGHFSGTVNFGAGSRTSAGASDTVIVKLPATGAPALWDRVAGGTAGDTVFELAATGVGSVVGVGTFASSSINFGTATLTRLGTSDGFVASYAPNGTAMWAKSWGGAGGSSTAYAVAANSLDELAIGGVFGVSANFGGGVRPSVGPADGFLLRLSSDGTYLSDGQFGSTGYCFPHGAATEPGTDAIVLGGNFQGMTDVDPGPGTYNVDGGGMEDGFVLKLKADGTF